MSPVSRLGRGLAAADERDHLVEVVEGDDEALEDVGPGLGLRSSKTVRRRTTSRRKSRK